MSKDAGGGNDVHVLSLKLKRAPFADEIQKSLSESKLTSFNASLVGA